MACSKEDAAPADTNTALLATHPWHIVAYTSTDMSVQPPKVDDWYPLLAAYRKDDTYIFGASGGLVFDEGTLKQNTTDPQIAKGSWQFQNNQTQLTITLYKPVPLGTTGNTSSTTYTVQQLSANTLRLQHIGSTQTVVVTLGM